MLGRCGVTDPHIESLQVPLTHQRTPDIIQNAWLQTSPEYAMKRLLAAYPQDMYQITPVFRAGDVSQLHRPEFTLLEWYRLDWDHHRLMQEVIALINQVNLALQQPVLPEPLLITYQQAFQTVLQLDPLSTDVISVQKRLTQLGHQTSLTTADPLDTWLDYALSFHVLPTLSELHLLIMLYDYPVSQAALARVTHNALGQAVAARFECILNGIELANGFHELQDAQQQRARFKQNQHSRQMQHQTPMAIDENLLAALDTLPDCAGVALGLDRLLMVLTGCDSLQPVISFANECFKA